MPTADDWRAAKERRELEAEYREEAEGFITSLFGESNEPELAPVEYDPNNVDIQSFMQGLLLAEGEQRETFLEHQARLQQEEVDQLSDSGRYPGAPSSKEREAAREKARIKAEEKRLEAMMDKEARERAKKAAADARRNAAAK
jgi:hypothetical protein